MLGADRDGQTIATGRAGLWNAWAIPDRIRTAPTHRRHGLGRYLMRALLILAHEAGARQAVLDASAEGRELYNALGWATVAGQFGVHRRAPSEPDSAGADA